MNCWLPINWLFFCFRKTPVVESHWSSNPSVQGRVDMKNNETTNTSKSFYSTRLLGHSPIFNLLVEFLRITVLVITPSWLIIVGSSCLRRRLYLVVCYRRHMNTRTNENRNCSFEKADSVNSLVEYFHVEMVDPFPLELTILTCLYLTGRYQFLNTSVKGLVCRHLGLRSLLLHDTCSENRNSSRVVRTMDENVTLLNVHVELSRHTFL